MFSQIRDQKEDKNKWYKFGSPTSRYKPLPSVYFASTGPTAQFPAKKETDKKASCSPFCQSPFCRYKSAQTPKLLKLPNCAYSTWHLERNNRDHSMKIWTVFIFWAVFIINELAKLRICVRWVS